MNTLKNTKTETPTSEREAPRTFATPAVDVYENDEGFLVRADLPGVTKDQLTLRFEDKRLFVEGRTLRGHHVLRRSFGLRETIDAEAIVARLEDGVLEVDLPKAERARPREIPVS